MELFVKRLMVGQMSPGNDNRKKIECVFIRQTAGRKQRMSEKKSIQGRRAAEGLFSKIHLSLQKSTTKH